VWLADYTAGHLPPIHIPQRNVTDSQYIWVPIPRLFPPLPAPIAAIVAGIFVVGLIASMAVSIYDDFIRGKSFIVEPVEVGRKDSDELMDILHEFRSKWEALALASNDPQLDGILGVQTFAGEASKRLMTLEWKYRACWDTQVRLDAIKLINCLKSLSEATISEVAVNFGSNAYRLSSQLLNELVLRKEP
jgi:hypothetical protein